MRHFNIYQLLASPKAFRDAKSILHRGILLEKRLLIKQVFNVASF